jgi:hypothetical protein
MPARIPGFGNIASSAGAAGIGGASQLQFDLERQMAEAALRAKARMKGANIQADATRYAGQQAANATMFGAIAGAVGNVVAPIAGGLASGAFNNKAGAARDQFLRNEADVKSTYQIPNYSKPITWGTGDWN